jgi:hypothetical protein
MEITNWITKCYSTHVNKNQYVFTKPKPIFAKPVYFKPILPNKFTQNKIYDLSNFVSNETTKRSNNKTLIDMFKEEKLNTNNQTSQLKWEEIVGFGIVSLGIWACYTYSGYKIYFVHTHIN